MWKIIGPITWAVRKQGFDVILGSALSHYLDWDMPRFYPLSRNCSLPEVPTTHPRKLCEVCPRQLCINEMLVYSSIPIVDMDIFLIVYCFGWWRFFFFVVVVVVEWNAQSKERPGGAKAKMN